MEAVEAGRKIGINKFVSFQRQQADSLIWFFRKEKKQQIEIYDLDDFGIFFRVQNYVCVGTTDIKITFGGTTEGIQIPTMLIDSIVGSTKLRELSNKKEIYDRKYFLYKKDLLSMILKEKI